MYGMFFLNSLDDLEGKKWKFVYNFLVLIFLCFGVYLFLLDICMCLYMVCFYLYKYI